MEQRAKLHCDECGNWIRVEQADGRVACECGRNYLVTITPMPSSTV